MQYLCWHSQIIFSWIKTKSTLLLSLQLCQAKGFICEFCQSADLLFPYQIAKCKRCTGMFRLNISLFLGRVLVCKTDQTHFRKTLRAHFIESMCIWKPWIAGSPWQLSCISELREQNQGLAWIWLWLQGEAIFWVYAWACAWDSAILLLYQILPTFIVNPGNLTKMFSHSYYSGCFCPSLALLLFTFILGWTRQNTLQGTQLLIHFFNLLGFFFLNVKLLVCINRVQNLLSQSVLQVWRLPQMSADRSSEDALRNSITGASVKLDSSDSWFQKMLKAKSSGAWLRIK